MASSDHDVRSPTLTTVFDSLMFTAMGISVIALVPAIFSKRVVRVKTWFTLLISNILYCVVHVLLVGRQSGPEPDRLLCIAQACMVYAAPPLLSGAALIFAVEVHMRLSEILLDRKVKEQRIYVMVLLLTHVPTTAFSLCGLIAYAKPSTVRRDPSGLFCHIDHPAPTVVTTVVTAGFIACMMVVNALIVLLMLSNSSAGTLWKRLNNAGIPLSSFLRIIIVTTIGLCAILFVEGINLRPSAQTFLSLGIVPLAISLVFVFQQGVVGFWFCWFPRLRRKTAVEDPPSHTYEPLPTPVSTPRSS